VEHLALSDWPLPVSGPICFDFSPSNSPVWGIGERFVVGNALSRR
jgi:hypothetical protein